MRTRIAAPAALAAAAVLLTSAAGRAQEQEKYYTFRSVLPAANGPGWCVDVPGPRYEVGIRMHLWDCVKQSNQSFGRGNESNITSGGLCVDSLGEDGRKAGEAGNPIGLAECDGSGHQVWEMQPLPDGNTFSIVSGGQCVTVDAPEGGRRAPLVLKDCDQSPQQAFTTGNTERPVYVANSPGSFAAVSSPVTENDEFYVYGGRRYCWYDGGWHGNGWYQCGNHQTQGVGWGGPIGWHFWHHHGHPVKKHPIILGKMPGGHGPGHGPGTSHGPKGPGSKTSSGPGKHPVVQKFPVVQKQVVNKRAPIARRAPVVKRAPVVRRPPPVVGRAPVVRRAPVANRAPVVRRAPVVNRAPVRKKR